MFVESSVSTLPALVEGRAKGHTVVVGGELFSDGDGACGGLTQGLTCWDDRPRHHDRPGAVPPSARAIVVTLWSIIPM